MENDVFKADMHIHTKYSGMMKYMGLKFPDSVEEPLKVMKCAKANNMDVIAVTDHNSIKGALEVKKLEKEFGIEVIVGSEIMSSEGEILGLFLNEDIPARLSPEETIERIHEQGGLAVCPHPYSPICEAIGDKVFELDFDGVEVYNAFHRDGIVNNIALDKVLKNYHKSPFAFLGNSDAHLARMIGNGNTKFEGNSADDLFNAIKHRKTTYEGTPTPLSDIILWSYNVIYASEKALLKSMVKKDDNIVNYNGSKFKKGIAAFGGLMYIGTPLPLVAGVLGNIYLKKKAKQKLKEVIQEVI
ncbi:PHP-associated domain-containing protein [Methanococcus maripaludis]|uniref:Polymerase/histidinol phosphatase N-terminal domain-containing protein n=1 Tax=Methanococcus maripaludis OS7 TaxID=637915 RepID=A0A2Z5PNY3_METMI|nr:PHP domain-containing protein [Methanococcus maripaludis]BAP62374.1 hypothetical protein MMOS7_02880 [Methanococcus maripaludis OS7]